MYKQNNRREKADKQFVGGKKILSKNPYLRDIQK